MYLVELDEYGLVKINGEYDGVLAIKEFRTIIQNEKLGIECFTAIALFADWLTPIRHYSDNDRPKRAMQEVSGSREKWDWYIDEIQICIARYIELQPNPDLLEKRNLDNLIIKALKDIEEEKDDDKVISLFKRLDILKGLRNAWIKDNKDNDLFSDGPVRNGYKLSRLEELAENKNSFYNKD